MAPITLQDKLKAALTADPKRTGVLVVLAVIMIGLWVHALQGGPNSASALMPAAPLPDDAQLTAGVVADHAASSNALIDWLSQPKRPAKRNLFAMQLDKYAKDPTGGGTSGRSGDSTYPEESEKSGGVLTDQNGEQSLRESLIKQASKLKLQSTFLGPSPMALVNGQLVREGDSIEKFQIVKIEPRRIAVRQNDITLQIDMD